MNPKQKILDAIKYVKEDLGYTLVSEDWGDSSKKCACALGCLLFKENPEKNHPEIIDGLSIHGKYKIVAQSLSVSEKWIDCFIEGFDDNGTADDVAIPEAWTMGHEVAQETKPISYVTWNGESV